MDTASVKECSICNHEFDEDQRCPRNLICGHCFCTFCINQLIVRNEKQCPYCRKGFEARCVEELPKNIIAIDLLKHVKDIETKATKGTEMSRSEMVKQMKQQSCQMNMKNILSCKDTINQIKSLKENNSELKLCISQNLLTLKYDFMSSMRELEEKYKAKVDYLEEETKKLDKLMTEAEEKLVDLEAIQVVLDKATTLVTVDNAVDKAEASNNAMESWIPKLKTEVSRDEQVHQGIQKSIKPNEGKIKTMKEILVSPLKEEDIIVKHMAAMSLQKPEILQKMNATMKCLTSLGGIYAAQKDGGITRYGRLSLNEHKLCLHHLTETQLPLNTCEIKFGDLMKYVDPSSRLTFLEFGNEEVTLGRVYIRLTPDTKRAQNFFLMCTGEKGFTYSGTSIHSILEYSNGNYICCGYYEKNKNLVGKALIQGSGEETHGLLNRKRELGSVGGWFAEGDDQASLFYIITKVKLPGKNEAVFGMMESGINVLAEANSLYPNMKNYYIIKDCGIVLIE